MTQAKANRNMTRVKTRYPAASYYAPGQFYLEDEAEAADDARWGRKPAPRKARPKSNDWMGGYRNHPTRTCVIATCRKEFIPKGPLQVTCGSEKCRKARKLDTTNDWALRERLKKEKANG